MSGAGQSLAAWMTASRWRVFGALLLTVGLPTALLSFLIFAQVSRALEQQSSYRNTVTARLAAQTVRERLEGLASYVESAAGGPELSSAVEREDWEAARMLLEKMLAHNPEFNRALIVDPAGELRADHPHDASVQGGGFALRDWYRGVSKSRKTYISEIYQREDAPQPYLVSVATPIRNADQEILGYLVGQHRIGALAAWFGRIRSSELDSVSFVLVDQKGGITTGQSADWDLPRRIYDHPLAERIFAGAEGWSRGPHPVTGERSLISFSPVGTTGWMVLACQPEKAVLAPILALRRIIFWLAFIFIAGILVIGFIWLNLIHSQLAERRRSAEALRLAWDELLHANEGLRAEIAERKRAESMLREAHADLQKSHQQFQTAQMSLIQAAKMESVGRLAAGVAHEVKNPLAVVMQGLDYLEGNLPPPARNKTVEMVLHDGKDAVRRADQVIRGLLDFSATRELELGQHDVNSVLRQALLLVKHELDKGQIQLAKELYPGLPPVLLDKQKMEQVFVNLLMNAIQATPRGGLLRVRTAARRLTETDGDPVRRRADRFRPGERVVAVEIEDTGTGIPEEILPRIFDPFVTLKPSGKGTGLGLTVTKSIVDLHGGSIDIQNRAEGGARVTLLFRVKGGNGNGRG